MGSTALLGTGPGGELLGMGRVAIVSGVLALALPVLLRIVQPRVSRREREEGAAGAAGSVGVVAP
jgi:hypothetical protein